MRYPSRRVPRRITERSSTASPASRDSRDFVESARARRRGDGRAVGLLSSAAVRRSARRRRPKIISVESPLLHTCGQVLVHLTRTGDRSRARAPVCTVQFTVVPLYNAFRSSGFIAGSPRPRVPRSGRGDAVRTLPLSGPLSAAHLCWPRSRSHRCLAEAFSLITRMGNPRAGLHLAPVASRNAEA